MRDRAQAVIPILTFIISLAYHQLAFAGSCVTTTTGEVSATYKICQGALNERVANTKVNVYMTKPVDCPSGTNSGTVVPSGGVGGGSYTGGSGTGTQSGGGGTIPGGSAPTPIAQDTCMNPTKYCPKCEDIVDTGSGVAVCNGTYVTADTDLRVPSRSILLEFTRTYRSNRIVKGQSGRPAFALNENNPLGFGWYSPFFARVEGDHYIDGEGNYHYFTMGSDGKYITDTKNGLGFSASGGSGGGSATVGGIGTTSTASIPTSYEITDFSGRRYTFDASGKLTAIKDMAGNTVTMTYDSSGRLDSVVDVMGRTVFTFVYTSDNHVESVTDLAGRSVRFAYSGGNMVSVTDLCGDATTYTYDAYGMTSKTNGGGTYALEYKKGNAGDGALSSGGSGGGTASVGSVWSTPEANPGMLGGGLVTSVSNPDGRVYKFAYDFSNRVFYSTDYSGNTLRWVYNNAGDLVSKQYVEGIPDSTTGGFSSSGGASGGAAAVVGNVYNREVLPNRVEKTTDEAGNVVTLKRDEWDNVISRVDGEGNEWRYTYSGKLMTSETDPMGVVTRYEYDSAGRLARKIEAAGTADEMVTVHTYDQWGGLLTTTRAGATVEYEYNIAGLPVSIKDPTGSVTRVEYDLAGNVTGTVDPLGNRTAMTYSVSGNLLTRKDALGNVTTFTYDDLCRLTSITDAKGNVTRYEHDYKGNITKVVNALDQGIAMEYDPSGNLTKATELGRLNADGSDREPADNIVTTMTYDKSNRRTFITDAEGNVTKYEYNGAGCGCPNGSSAATPARITDPLGNVTENTFDKAGKVIGTKDPMGYVSSITYNPAGRVISQTDSNGKTTKFNHDSLGRLLSQTDAAGGVTGFTYDAAGNLSTVTDAMGNTTTYEYDLAGRKTKETRPMGEYAVFTYDAAGNLKTKTDAKGQVTAYSYDKLDRLAEVVYADGKKETFGYDERGALTGYTGDPFDSAQGRLSGTMTYDALGRKTSETVNYGAFSKSYSYSYDKLGNKASFTGPEGAVYSYGYTKLHQPSAISWQGGSIAYDYRWNKLVKQALPNGIVTDYAYNANGWLTGITAKRADGPAVMDYQYTGFDNVGNITARDTEHGAYSYGYDNLYRLTSAQSPALPAEAFSYDKVGNRLTSAEAPNWNYNANNALIGYDGVNYSYDPNGNTISKSVSGQVTAFAYNSKDRLEQINLPDGKIAVYKYDPFGRRISKTVDGAVTYFMYADEGLVAEMDSAGAVVKSYGWMPDGTWGTDPVLMAEGGQTYFYHNDHLGTPQKMTDAVGNVVWSATYTAFGEANVNAASTITNNLRYPGQYYDSETGLHYNWHRYYDPGAGAYLSQDPIGLNGGINLYKYVLNRPIHYSDPFGLDAGVATATWVGGALAGGASAAATAVIGGTSAVVVVGSVAGSLVFGATYYVTSQLIEGTWLDGGLGEWLYEQTDDMGLVRKMEYEISRIISKIEGPQGVQYSLRAAASGCYPNVSGGKTYLKAGDVWKYGETTNPADRYNTFWLKANNLTFVEEYYGSKLEIKVAEKMKIYSYFITHRHLPPGNKIFR